ncbi:hypothetical protein D3C73_1254460 [compost metagenome]
MMLLQQLNDLTALLPINGYQHKDMLSFGVLRIFSGILLRNSDSDQADSKAVPLQIGPGQLTCRRSCSHCGIIDHIQADPDFPGCAEQALIAFPALYLSDTGVMTDDLKCILLLRYG